MSRALSALPAVAVPDLPPPPEAYAPGPFTVFVFVLVGLAMIVFVAVIVWSTTGSHRQRATPWRAVLWPAGIALVLCAVGVGLVLSGQRSAAADVEEYDDARVAAEAAARAELEVTYGIEFLSDWSIPVEDGEVTGEHEVRLPDGSQAECFVLTEDGRYEIRCGGDTVDEASALEPVVG